MLEDSEVVNGTQPTEWAGDWQKGAKMQKYHHNDSTDHTRIHTENQMMMMISEETNFSSLSTIIIFDYSAT